MENGINESFELCDIQVRQKVANNVQEKEIIKEEIIMRLGER